MLKIRQQFRKKRDVKRHMYVCMKVDRRKPTTEGRHWEAAYASSVLVELPTKIMQNI